MQSRLQSLIEAWVNVIIGFGISIVANLVVLPAFGYSVSLADAFGIGIVFTAVSIVRSYLIRRWFNRMLARAFK